jgi:hypothetical protein
MVGDVLPHFQLPVVFQVDRDARGAGGMVADARLGAGGFAAAPGWARRLSVSEPVFPDAVRNR